MSLHTLGQSTSSSPGKETSEVSWTATTSMRVFPLIISAFAAAESSIGEGSCSVTDADACLYNSGKIAVGDNSCFGSDDVCSLNELGNSTGEFCLQVGSDSCQGSFVCSSNLAPLVVGDGSCIGNATCVASGNGLTIGDDSCTAGSACFICSAHLTVGNQSCTGNGSCSFVSEDSTIGNRACTGDNSCSISYGGIEVGDGSCTGEQACSTNYALFVGQGACTGYGSCLGNIAASIGDNSCQGENSCTGLTVTGISIGSNSCNGPDACLYCSGDVPDNADDCSQASIHTGAFILKHSMVLGVCWSLLF